jgi:putative transposase
LDVRRLCGILKVSRQGYYHYLKKKKSSRTLENEVLCEEIKKIFYENKGIYGSPRIAFSLNDRGIFVSKNRVARHMKKMNLQSKVTKRRRKGYKHVQETLISENLLNQSFSTNSKNKIWVGDITYIPVANTNIYLSTFIDIFTRKVVGWTLDKRMDQALVINSLEKALKAEKPTKGLIIHTDRGSQYTSKEFQRKVLKYGAISSMSRPGNPYDNALMESFYKSLKSELLIDGRFETMEKSKNAIFEYIEMFYNTKRLHSSLGYMSPIQFENQF